MPEAKEGAIPQRTPLNTPLVLITIDSSLT